MERWQAPLRFIGLGWFVGICIVAGVLGGNWLDNNLLHTRRPTLAVAGLILGVVVAFYGVYRMVLPSINKIHNKRKH